jgi:uncharacterized membrane protein
VRQILHTILHAWVANRHWMAWNLVLAVIPALLALRLFRPGRRPSRGWWVGVAAFALFLPNAPYVVSDLVHLPDNVATAPSRSSVLLGFLPSYAVFIAVGLLCYAFCLHRLRRWLGARSLDPAWVAIEIVIHGVSAVGVLIGRVARLNSWDAVVHPRNTLWTSLATLSHPRSLLVVVLFAFVLFVACRVLSLVLAVASHAGPAWARSPRRRPGPT